MRSCCFNNNVNIKSLILICIQELDYPSVLSWVFITARVCRSRPWSSATAIGGLSCVAAFLIIGSIINSMASRRHRKSSSVPCFVSLNQR